MRTPSQPKAYNSKITLLHNLIDIINHVDLKGFHFTSNRKSIYFPFTFSKLHRLHVTLSLSERSRPTSIESTRVRITNASLCELNAHFYHYTHGHETLGTRF